MYFLVLKQLLIMMMIAVLSFIFSRRNRFCGAESEFLSRILLFLVNPCLIVNAFNVAYDAEKMKRLLFVIIISIGVHLLLTLVATTAMRSGTSQGRLLDGLDRIGVVFTNCGFIGIPLINGVFGPSGVFYLMGYIVVFNVYLWIYGEYLMSGHISWKKVVTNPNVIAVAAGIVLFCLPFTLPGIVGESLSLIAGLNTALSMILLGMLFAGFHKTAGGISYTKRVIKASVVRLVVSSFVVLAFLYAVYRLFSSVEDLREILFVVYIASLCPIGMSASTFACIFKKDASYTSLIVSVTSVLCIVTVPLFVGLGELFIK
ncbi:MAG: AEC family transporter [Treponema sp.]|nr:AEC family transporter [Treponema sp.]